uniref:Uncharacterized protein n=1 Tax=Anguilla anguilla TaxID=7936 RepID=A0A0E9V4U1_ANGAN
MMSARIMINPRCVLFKT